MYCSISCSRACRSPSSWYRRRRILSLSGTHPPLHQPDAVAVDVHLVDGRLEHTPHAELGACVALERLEQARAERADHCLESVVVDGHADRHLVLVAPPCAVVEQGAERDLQILEVLERQIEPRRQAGKHEM